MDKEFMIFNGTKKFDPKTFKTKIDDTKLTKEIALPLIAENNDVMALLQDKLYAHNKDALLIIIQAMDAGGKDSLVKHVMSGLNPQGVQAYSFKSPSAEELNHDYMWRCFKCLPERGRIGIFNRSYYEDVLISKVHNLPLNQNLPKRCMGEDLWEKRYRQINDFEKYLDENGIMVLKFFLHISKDEQKKRFLKRIDNEVKNWKFAVGDIHERGFWDEYADVYEEAINKTSTKIAPWHIIPADAKWYAKLSASELIIEHLKAIDPKYPTVPEKEVEKLQTYKTLLLNEES